jgi:DNA-binding CsgD family transcriptional regulator
MRTRQICPNCGVSVVLEVTRPVTHAEVTAIREIANAFTDPEIAQKLGISQPATKARLARVFEKLGVRSRVQLAVYWECELFQIGLRELGLIPDGRT